MISIVVPIYNVEKYLEQCLDSLRRQTYSDIEIIMINDGSPDNCQKICERYCKLDNRFSLINKQNQGLGLARNTGLQYVQGEYVVFMDSDDYLHDTAIEKLYEAAQLYHADTVIGNFERVNDKGEHLPYGNYSQEFAIYENDAVKKELLPKMFGSCPEGGDTVSMGAVYVLYTTDLIQKNHLCFCSERDFISEDLFFNLDYYCYARKVCILSDELYYYRLNEDSLSSPKRYCANRLEMKQKIYEEGCKRLRQVGIYEETKYRFMKYYFLGICACIRQETPEISGKSKKECKQQIRNICCDKYLMNMLAEYPIKRMGIKQRTFLFLVKHRCTSLLMWLSLFGLLG